MENIPTFEELIEAYKKGKLPKNEKGWYIMYPTELHKKEDSKGFIPYIEVVKWAALEEEIDKKVYKIFWKS